MRATRPPLHHGFFGAGFGGKAAVGAAEEFRNHGSRQEKATVLPPGVTIARSRDALHPQSSYRDIASGKFRRHVEPPSIFLWPSSKCTCWSSASGATKPFGLFATNLCKVESASSGFPIDSKFAAIPIRAVPASSCSGNLSRNVCNVALACWKSFFARNESAKNR